MARKHLARLVVFLQPDPSVMNARSRFHPAAATILLAALLISALASTAVAESDRGPVFSQAERSWWAFQPVKRPAVPTVKHPDRVRTPIDAFLLESLEAKGLELSPPTDKITLLRRASLDLIGLPPTPAELDAFLADESPDAYAKQVDRLLASPQYGERWGRHWLDVARFAESDGFKEDEARPGIWRYRDYVIKSFNEDKPYDRFVKEQIAGDELWPDDADAVVATSFNRHYPDEWNARNLFLRRQETLNDITDTVGAVFTGMTVACARCHDHKYDAIRQADYYRLQAFFANTAAADRTPLATAAQVEEYKRRLAIWEEKTKVIRAEIDAIEAPYIKEAIDDFVRKYPPEIQAMIAKSPAERTPYEAQICAKANQYILPSSWAYLGQRSKIIGRLKKEEKARWDKLQEQLEAFKDSRPEELPTGPAMKDLSDQAPPTFLLRRGLWDAPKNETTPGFYSIFEPEPAKVTPVAYDGSNSTGRRTALANLLADPKNPLTARVMVNRIWQHHFGRGIVGTPSDFGVKGDPPTHPKLLDWLADEFVAGGWSMKHLHRLILLSDAYRQAPERPSAVAGKVDPENHLLWAFPRQRLEAETIRDAMLAVAGDLNLKMYGPSVFPELPPGMANRGNLWKASADPAERDRRSVYVFVRRNNRYPLFDCLDEPDTLESCARRNVTTTPLQALNLLNSKLTLEWARHFAARVIERAAGSANIDEWTDAAFRLAYCRRPDADEVKTVQEFFVRQRPVLAERAAAGDSLMVPEASSADVDKVDAACLVDLCHMLLNSNEFIYQN